MIEIQALMFTRSGDRTWVRKTFKTETAFDRWLEKHEDDIVEVRYATESDSV